MSRLKGIAMIITGAILWGATGPIMEWILGSSGMTVAFMLTVRLLSAGVLLLSLLKLQGKRITLPWRQKIWARQLLLFGVFGMLGVQYSFVAAIEASNAIMGTLFQFLAPIFIIVFVSVRQKVWPPVVQVLGIVVTLIGLVLLVTNGSFSAFALSGTAVFWGIVVGFTFSFYTLFPVRLMNEWGVLLSIGWGMIIGGMTLFIVNPLTVFSQVEYLADWSVSRMLLVVIVIGTLAFTLFLGSMKHISPVETSILSSFEPLTAMIISVLWLGQVLGMWQLTGSIIMLGGVTWLSIAGSKVKT